MAGVDFRLSCATPKTKNGLTSARIAESSVFKNQHPVHLCGNGMIMGYYDQAGLQFLVQFQHESQHMCTISGIEIASWFIRQYQFRSRDQCSCDGCPLTFPAGEFTWFVI